MTGIGTNIATDGVVQRNNFNVISMKCGIWKQIGGSECQIFIELLSFYSDCSYELVIFLILKFSELIFYFYKPTITTLYLLIKIIKYK